MPGFHTLCCLTSHSPEGRQHSFSAFYQACGSHKAMTSAAPQKRMVSSFFITLASPHRATVTQQQPALQAHSSPACDTQHRAVRVHPSDSIPSARHKKEDHSQTETHGGLNGRGCPAGASVPLFHPQRAKPTGLESSQRNQQAGDSRAAGMCEEIFLT